MRETVAAVDLPVLAAGGIGTFDRVTSLLDAGAAGVRVGTRFLAATECDSHPEYVRALIAAGKRDTEVTQTFCKDWPDAPHRVLRTSIEMASRLDSETVGELGDWPIPRFSAMPPHRNARGKILAMACYAGESVEAVTAVQPATEIVRELMRDV